MDNRRRNRDWPNVVGRGNVQLGPGGRLGHSTRCVCGVAMPIRPYLDGHAFDAETVRLLSIAFEITRAGIKVEEWDEPGEAIIAAKLIELAEQGERDPERLSGRALAWFDGTAPAVATVYRHNGPYSVL